MMSNPTNQNTTATASTTGGQCKLARAPPATLPTGASANDNPRKKCEKSVNRFVNE